MRELAAQDKVRYEAFAATIKAKSKKYVHRRYPRCGDGLPQRSERPIRVNYCGEATVRSLSSVKSSLYCAENDLRELAENILNSAPTRRGKPDKRRRKPARHQSVELRDISQ